MIWVFLGALTLVVVIMAVVAAKTDKNIIPVDVDRTWTTIAAFYRTHRDPSAEVDLGKGWTSAHDPGAMIALSWSSGTASSWPCAARPDRTWPRSAAS